jgi:hypothetical protein
VTVVDPAPPGVRVIVDELKEVENSEFVDERVNVPENPSMLARSSVDESLVDGVIVRWGFPAVIAKSGPVTVTGTSTKCSREHGLTASMETLSITGAVSEVTVTVSVEVELPPAVSVRLDGLSAAFTEKAKAERNTVPMKPLRLVAVRVTG